MVKNGSPLAKLLVKLSDLESKVEIAIKNNSSDKVELMNAYLDLSEEIATMKAKNSDLNNTDHVVFFK
jgi:uncharacterized protein (DUF342 family)